VESNAVFAGKVLVRDGLEVAGPLQVGGELALASVRVTGNSSFDDVQVANDLAVTGDTSVQGQLVVQRNLNVNGTGSFKGAVSAAQITTGNLQLNGDLILTHHVIAGGAGPSRSNGSALGSGGTATVNGSDTSGTVNINTGNSPPAGCFVTVNFVRRYDATPRVIITPVGSTAGSLSYYINRSTTGFSICTNSPAPGARSFAFDYWVAG
jgi:cytoskeletal protein CcmA (bactofilin family)